MVQEWQKMKEFGDWLIGHGISCAESKGNISHNDKIWERRVGLTLVHQAAEILMKAYLVKRGDSIKRDNRTIQFLEAFDKINFSEIERTKFEKFNKIRNEMYHHSFQVPWDKDAEIRDFLEEFKKLYDKGFVTSIHYDGPQMKEKFRKIHK